MKVNLVDTAVCCTDLVLGTDGFPEQILFNVNAFLRQLMFAGNLTLESIQGVQQAHREGRTGAHATSARKVTVVMNFEPTIQLQIPQNLTHSWVGDLIHRLTGLILRINNADSMFKKWR